MAAAHELAQRAEATAEALLAAVALLERIDAITTEEFARGAERKERERLRAALVKLGLAEP